MQSNLFFISVCVFFFNSVIFSSPYTFYNDSMSDIILADNQQHAYFVKPFGQVTVDTPKTEKVRKGKSNGHAPISVYAQQPEGYYALMYHIQERASGLGGFIKALDLDAYAMKKKSSGRFSVTFGAVPAKPAPKKKKSKSLQK